LVTADRRGGDGIGQENGAFVVPQAEEQVAAVLKETNPRW
jgi:hypothetical protein